MANLWLYDAEEEKWTRARNDGFKVIPVNEDNQVIEPVQSAPITIIDNALFTETVTGADIDFKTYRHALLSIKTGTATDSPTMTVKLQIKDSNGNYIDHTTLSAINTATTVIEEFFYLSAETIRVICTYGGSGNFANTTVELRMKS